MLLPKSKEEIPHKGPLHSAMSRGTLRMKGGRLDRKCSVKSSRKWTGTWCNGGGTSQQPVVVLLERSKPTHGAGPDTEETESRGQLFESKRPRLSLWEIFTKGKTSGCVSEAEVSMTWDTRCVKNCLWWPQQEKQERERKKKRKLCVCVREREGGNRERKEDSENFARFCRHTLFFIFICFSEPSTDRLYFTLTFWRTREDGHEEHGDTSEGNRGNGGGPPSSPCLSGEEIVAGINALEN